MTLFQHSLIPASALRGMAVAKATIIALALFVMGALCLTGVSAQQSEGTVAAIEAQELKTALSVTQKQVAELEKANATLRESLAESNRVAGDVRSQYEELLLRMASFGVDLVKPDPKSIEHRLLQAVRAHEEAEQEKQMVVAELARLSEAVMGFLPEVVSANGEAQARLEAELATAGTVLGQANREEASGVRSLKDGKVVSIDSEIGLVVLNVGSGSGVRIGMPISVIRDNRPVGVAQVVDVRDTISGALLKELSGSGDVRVGDRIVPRAESL